MQQWQRHNNAASWAHILLRRLCDKFPTKSWTQIMKVGDTKHVADFHDLCLRQVRDFVGNFPRAL